MEKKTKKVLNIVVNTVVYVIFAIVLFLTIMIIASGGKGYTSFFGTAFVAVQSDSMDGDKEDSFAKGALLTVDILDEEEKAELKVGDIVTFYDSDIIQGKRVLNSHRIVEITEAFGSTVYVTRGDKAGATNDAPKKAEDIVGLVTGHADGIGNVSLWLNSSTGFLVCVVIPSFLILAYCVYNLIRTVRVKNGETEEEKKERLKQELLEELRAEGKLTDTEEQQETQEPAPASSEAPAEEAPAEETAPVEEAPAEETIPAEETAPIEEAPAEEAAPQKATPKKTTKSGTGQRKTAPKKSTPTTDSGEKSE